MTSLSHPSPPSFGTQRPVEGTGLEGQASDPIWISDLRLANQCHYLVVNSPVVFQSPYHGL